MRNPRGSRPISVRPGIRGDILEVGSCNPAVDDVERGDDDGECGDSRPQAPRVTVQQRGNEHDERREDCQRVELQAQDHHGHGSDEVPGPLSALPLEDQGHEPSHTGDEKYIHPRRLRIVDEVRQERDGGGQREIPGRLEESPPRGPRQQDQQHAAQRRRKAQRPFALAEDFDGGGHEVELSDGARVEHPAGHARSAMLDQLHRRQGHGLLIAVQPDRAEPPEAHERPCNENQHEPCRDWAAQMRPRVANFKEGREAIEPPSDIFMRFAQLLTGFAHANPVHNRLRGSSYRHRISTPFRRAAVSPR